jgi:hypothetical protein
MSVAPTQWADWLTRVANGRFSTFATQRPITGDQRFCSRSTSRITLPTTVGSFLAQTGHFRTLDVLGSYALFNPRFGARAFHLVEPSRCVWALALPSRSKCTVRHLRALCESVWRHRRAAICVCYDNRSRRFRIANFRHYLVTFDPSPRASSTQRHRTFAETELGCYARRPGHSWARVPIAAGVATARQSRGRVVDHCPPARDTREAPAANPGAGPPCIEKL